MSVRPPVFTWNEELHFGPPSEPIHIQSFLEDASKLRLRGRSPWFSKDGCDTIPSWQTLPQDTKTPIEMDCNLDVIKSSLMEILASQKHVSFLRRTQATSIEDLSISQSLGRKKGKSKKPTDDTELQPLKRTIEQTPLKMWPLKPASKPYVRAGHVSDQNALDTLKPQGNAGTGIAVAPALSDEALITLTAYKRNSWYPFAFTRNTQYILPSISTLADIWDCILCTIKGEGRMPREIIEVDGDGDEGEEGNRSDMLGHHHPRGVSRVVGYNVGDNDPDPIVMVIENTAYSDGHGSPDYADKLISHVEALKPPPPVPDGLPSGPYERPKGGKTLHKGPSIHTVSLRSLTLRINEPYWILHRGNCEHWFAIDEIRLQNPRDPSLGYPIGLQRTPASRSLCRICSKVPATLAILNDVRLGESPATPKQGQEPETRVFVVPILADTF
ncbi:hypothetical protein K439DRAFT_1663597 [Ramaria rubella]|nr:hypothetical protein K439DRAFT_1663597 [Ramaria rubella]